MNFYGMTLNEIVSACNEMNVNTPGGFINQYGNKYIVRGMVRTDKSLIFQTQ